MDTACGRALDLDVVSVTKIAAMLEKAIENAPAPHAASQAAETARFARDPAEYRVRPHWLPVIDGGAAATEAQK